MTACIPERRLVGRFGIEEVVEAGHSGGADGREEEGRRGERMSVTGERKRQE